MKKRLEICICGGGNLAHALSAVIGAMDFVKVNVLTRQPHKWRKEITAIYRDSLILKGRLNKISESPENVIPCADIVIFALPTLAHEQVIKKIRNYLSEQTWVGAIPAWGGFDWQVRQILGEKSRVFGVHRVSHICRTVRYGSTVDISGVSPELFIAGFPSGELRQLTANLENILNIPFIQMDNFLPVTLTPSNSLCHPVRLYSLFSDWQPGKYFERIPLFYKEWDSLASELFIRCGNELQQIRRNIPLNLSKVPSIFVHYGVSSSSELTRRMQKIDALSKIQAPLLQVPAGYVPDLKSRYFTEDIPYGLMIISAIGRLANVETPVIDSLIKWGQNLLNKKYIDDENSFAADAAYLPLPQNFGIETLSELVRRAAN